MAIKINRLEIENVKRVKAVKLEPSQNGLTIIGGNNNQGKTSILDAIAWALGGDKYRPSKAQREQSVIPPNLHIVMNNGLVVERKGKNSSLKVTDPDGKKRRHFCVSLESGNSLQPWRRRKRSSGAKGRPSAGLRIRKKSMQRNRRIIRMCRSSRFQRLN